MENKLINGQYYLINGTKCKYDKGIFFWESEDGTKWFRAESLRGTNADIEIIKP